MSAERKLALRVNDKDNVATIFANDVRKGATVDLIDKQGRAEAVTLLGDIPYGHKIAARDIAFGAEIIKYGEAIGAASKDIKKGEHVHVHNLDSMRGRGDLLRD